MLIFKQQINNRKQGENMKLKIRKWGSSGGILIPKPLLELLNAKIGDQLEVEFNGPKMILQKSKSKK